MPRVSALLVLAVAYVLAFASGGLQLPLTSTAMASVGLSMSSVGVMWSARSVLGIFGPALWGVLADKRGDARPFAAASLLIGALLLVVLSLSTSTTPALVPILVFGLYGLFTGPSGSLLDGMTLTALGDKKSHFGRWRMWGTIGFGVTSFGASMLVDAGRLDVRPGVVFPVAAALTGTAGVAVLFVPKLPRPQLARYRDVLPIVMRKDMLALFALTTVLWASHIGYASFLMPLATARGLPEWSVAGSLLAAIVVEAIVLRSAGLALVRFSARQIFVGVAVLAVLRWALTALTMSPEAFVVLNALHGVTFGLFFATLVSHVAVIAPASMRQAAQGVIGSSAFGLGGGLGSLVCGALIEHAGAAATWWVMAAMAALGVLIAVVSRAGDTAAHDGGIEKT